MTALEFQHLRAARLISDAGIAISRLTTLTINSNTSVLPPPPPRYTIPVAYAAGAANGMAVPVVETNNTISHPEGGCPLQVGEGEC